MNPYGFYPGQPPWPTIQKPVYEEVPTRVCIACQVERKVTSFGSGSKKCSGCYSKEKRAKDKKLSLEPKRLLPIDSKRHGGAYSRAGA